MPTTFNVMYLGDLSIIDPVEGNTLAENAGDLVGLSFGSAGDPLFSSAQEWSIVGSPGSFYHQDNNIANDQFQTDGGTAQTFDAAAVYSATLTYLDGTTATISAVIAQDITGATYLVPEFSNNADQAALEAGPIESISLNSLLGANFSGLTSSREEWDFLTCFAEDTRIKTAMGPRRVQNIKLGDMIPTYDGVMQPVRWIGSTTVLALGSHAPVLFKAGSIGNTRDIRVSQMHRMMLGNWQAELYAGMDEALVAAKHLVNGDDIVLETGGTVTYYHLLFDQHELIWSEGALSESFHPGELALSSLDQATRDEVLTLFPELKQNGIRGYGPTARPALRRHEAILSS